MKKTTDTAVSMAPRSLASARPYSHSLMLASGTPLCEHPSQSGVFEVTGGSFAIAPGGALVTARLTVDDSGVLEIRNAAGEIVMSVESSLAARE